VTEKVSASTPPLNDEFYHSQKMNVMDEDNTPIGGDEHGHFTYLELTLNLTW